MMGCVRFCRSKCCSGLDGSIILIFVSSGVILLYRLEICVLVISMMGVVGEFISVVVVVGKFVVVGSIIVSGFVGWCFCVCSVVMVVGLLVLQVR